MKYQQGVVGGTFDLFHIGHKKLLQEALTNCKHLTIGITSDLFNEIKGKITYEDQKKRSENIERFLEERNHKNTKLVFIDDIYGITLNESALDAIYVTEDTIENAKLINAERLKRKMSQLVIECVPLVMDEERKVVSSTRIRNGQINQDGNSSRKLLSHIADKQLSDDVKNKLKNPFGQIINIASFQKPDGKIITVGDITTQKLIAASVVPDIAIVDFKTERQNKFKKLQELGLSSKDPDYTAENHPGLISSKMIQIIELTLENGKENQVILVDGEEDLAVIPSVLLAPLGTYIYYGQPYMGMVEIKVTLEVKNQLCKMLNLGIKSFEQKK